MRVDFVAPQSQDGLLELGLIKLTWNPYPPDMTPSGPIFLRLLVLRLCEISAVAVSADRKGALVVTEGGKEYQVEETWDYVMKIWGAWLAPAPK